MGFQSTLPARGATDGTRPPCAFRGFQSTLPARGATTRSDHAAVSEVISIHAPREGSDLTGDDVDAVTWEFQSTLPARGATFLDPTG